MRVYDISQELLSCKVFPGDPAPKREQIKKVSEGEVCNLSLLSLCAHNGTHVDAPYHFLEDGKTVDEISLEHFIGPAYVATHQGVLGREDAIAILTRAREENSLSTARILIRGEAVVSIEAANVFAEAKVLLIGNESQTVGPENAPKEVHLKLLSEGIVLLEGIRLSHVPDGVYLLNCAPINVSGSDGAPCRAILMEV